MDGYAPRYKNVAGIVAVHRDLPPVPYGEQPELRRRQFARVYVSGLRPKSFAPLPRNRRVGAAGRAAQAHAADRGTQLRTSGGALRAEYLHSRPEQCPVTVIRVNEGVCGEHSISDWHDFSRERRGRASAEAKWHYNIRQLQYHRREQLEVARGD